jgi:hypothetical protein
MGHPMYPMNDLRYRYRPWSEERRRKASERAKARLGQTPTTALVYGVTVPVALAPAIRRSAYRASRKRKGGELAAMKAIADMLAAALLGGKDGQT